MGTAKKKGRFRIQSVAEMIGVPASTLRAWEQRYGFPSPERTASAYRVYNQDDIDLIGAVRARCDEGMAPAEAVAAVLEERSQPAPATQGAATRARPPAVLGTSAPEPASSPVVERIIDAALKADPAALDEAIRGTLLLATVATAFESVLAPAWSVVRQRWATGELDGGRARIALEVFGHAARDLIRMGQPTPAAGHVVLAPIPDEDDVIPLVPLALAAQSQSLRAVLVAPRTSAAAIGDAATAVDARWVGVCATEAAATRRTREVFDDIASRVGNRDWVVCGPATSPLAELVERCGGSVAAAPGS